MPTDVPPVNITVKVNDRHIPDEEWYDFQKGLFARKSHADEDWLDLADLERAAVLKLVDTWLRHLLDTIDVWVPETFRHDRPGSLIEIYACLAAGQVADAADFIQKVTTSHLEELAEALSD